MSAFINALREEGTKEDCLVQIERLLDEKNAMAARIEELEKALENTREPVQSWPPPVYRIHPKS
jgi:trans-2-enoyl-CoA reductase